MEELGKALFVVVPIALSVAILSLIAKVILGWKKGAPKKSGIAEVVDAAMKEDVPVEKPKQTGKYTWDDLQRDIRDPKLTFDEILEKCGGVLPEEPEPEKNDGVPSQEEDPKLVERKAQLQAWFAKRAEVNPVLKVVPPPPQATPVVTLRGQTLKCPYCNGSGRRSGPLFTTSNFNMWPPPPDGGKAGSKCDRCQGHGYVVVSGD